MLQTKTVRILQEEHSACVRLYISRYAETSSTKKALREDKEKEPMETEWERQFNVVSFV